MPIDIKISKYSTREWQARNQHTEAAPEKNFVYHNSNRSRLLCCVVYAGNSSSEHETNRLDLTRRIKGEYQGTSSAIAENGLLLLEEDCVHVS